MLSNMLQYNHNQAHAVRVEPQKGRNKMKRFMNFREGNRPRCCLTAEAAAQYRVEHRQAVKNGDWRSARILYARLCERARKDFLKADALPAISAAEAEALRLQHRQAIKAGEYGVASAIYSRLVDRAMFAAERKG